MDSAQLQARIARWEDLHTDFKAKLSSPVELAKDLVCFANTDGGQLIVGVAESRAICGVEDPDAVHRFVDNVAYQNCEPPISVVQEVVELAGRKVVVINIPKGTMRPYRTNTGKYYTRTTSGCRDASREELLRLFQAVESLSYDETPLPRLTLTDLDLSAFERFLTDTGQANLPLDPHQLLRNWGLAVGDQPTIAGLLLFGREPQRYLPFAQINAARFPGVDSSAAPSDRKDLGGRLLEVIDQAERFVRLHLPLPHEIKGFEPEPRPEIPWEVFREAIVNAVGHRDYTVQGPVRLFIFDDRVEVHTPGRPPNTVDAVAMRFGVHVVRNPRIYSRLSDAGLVTRAGTGVRRMVRLVQEATGRDLEIAVRDFEVLFTIPRPARRNA
jgi:ATP-dependent DNA helicase RecG